MSALTDEQKGRLIELAYGPRPPRLMWLEQYDCEDIVADALERCLTANRGEMDRKPPPRHAKWLRETGRSWDPVHYLWKEKLRDAYRLFLREQQRKKKLEAQFSETISEPFDPVLHKTMAEETRAELEKHIHADAESPLERIMADLLKAGYKTREIHEETGASLYQIKNVRARFKRKGFRVVPAVERASGELQQSWLAPGCRHTAPKKMSDGIELTEPAESWRPSLRGWRPPKATRTPEERAAERKEIKEAVRRIEARKAEIRGRHGEAVPQAPGNTRGRSDSELERMTANRSAPRLRKTWRRPPAANDDSSQPPGEPRGGTSTDPCCDAPLAVLCTARTGSKLVTPGRTTGGRPHAHDRG